MPEGNDNNSQSLTLIKEISFGGEKEQPEEENEDNDDPDDEMNSLNTSFTM